MEFVVKRREEEGEKAVVEAIQDEKAEEVQRLAVSSVTPGANQEVMQAIAALLHARSWALRVRAAEALERIGPPAKQAEFSALADATRTAAYALVRDAPVKAAARVDRPASTPIV